MIFHLLQIIVYNKDLLKPSQEIIELPKRKFIQLFI
jgi:hypothetical protein